MTASKARFFQVVPVPGVFTRGRWECCDSRDEESNATLSASASRVPLNERITPTEMLTEYGLEKSLNAAAECDEVKGLCPDGSCGASPQGASSACVPTVAINSKIEQAMDLVKTHVVYAVREEMDGLRKRIVELEGRLTQLETENSTLREHISPDILQTLQLPTPPKSTPVETDSASVPSSQA